MEMEHKQHVAVGQEEAVDFFAEFSDFSIPLPQWFKDWIYAGEGATIPWFESGMFYVNMMPVMFMCEIMAVTLYP